MSMDDIWRLDATDQAALVRTGEVGPTALVQAALERIERLDPLLGAVVGLDAAGALARAEQPGAGPFAGVPFLAKDLLAYPGLPAAMGCRLFAGHVPTDHLPYTRRRSRTAA
jgi:amidase